MRIFFATDIHGSEICFRKFCAAASFYDCDVLILGGDVTGKLLIPIVLENSHGVYELGGVRRRFSRDALDLEIERIANMGYYGVITKGEDSVSELGDPETYERILVDEALKRAEAWVEYAETKLASSAISIVIAPGNDDHFAIDEVFRQSDVFTWGEEAIVELDGLEVVSSGWSNPTPWKTHRELPEDELEARLRRMISCAREPELTIFNFHVPPYGTSLDLCPDIDDDFRIVTVVGSPIIGHHGSTAVRKLIEEFQPRLSLHGHIHESRAFERIGRSLALNPGSEYGDGVLRGVVIQVESKDIRHTFTAG